ncbi:emp24/gp25L/p24 family/GOLD [Carpediemonas membranifera]|uniref:Emp24/gp25L/p24 family/GOLD n=1 Tax=Carpediemonas membranifera TaxID=201153 RepID=A0A8J6B5A9_9EUKA|nr:emp24/gp25L/p24 family/GOLD [Carpediemonas membranifera]|eukprot:KAG9395973.1 emp24/gp25L/p24 family/GOLD [Carpediemonas membranifera]
MCNFRLVTILCCMMIAIAAVQAVSYDLQVSNTFCFTEELTSHTLVIVEFTAEPDNTGTMEVSVNVRAPNRDIIYSKYGVTNEKSKFVFTAVQEGDYQFCFNNILVQPPRGMIMSELKRRVNINLRTGSEAIDPSDSVNQDHVNVFEWELLRIEGSLNSIKRDFGFMKRRDAFMQIESEKTRSRIAWFSLLVVMILIVSGTAQTFMMSGYFKSKKIV